MKLFFLFIHIFLIFSSYVYAMEEKGEQVKTVSDISLYCFHVAKKVSEQQFCSSQKKPTKTVYLANYDDVRIVEIINSNASKILGERDAWKLEGFDKAHVVAHSYVVERGITLCDSDKQASTETLKKVYEKVVALLQQDWKTTTLEERPNIFIQKNPEEWNLFRKKPTLLAEDSLICFLMGRFKMEKAVHCHSERLNYLEKDAEPEDEIYLWVKKNSQEKFDDIFGFQYQKIN